MHMGPLLEYSHCTAANGMDNHTRQRFRDSCPHRVMLPAATGVTYPPTSIPLQPASPSISRCRMLRRPIFVPCLLMRCVPLAVGMSPCRIMNAASGPVELPVAGSSLSPYSGANIREYAPSALGLKTNTQNGSVSRSLIARDPSMPKYARSTAALSFTPTNTVGFPADPSWGVTSGRL